MGDRSKELRAMMKTKGGSAAASVLQSKEKARQLKLARQQGQQQSQQQPQHQRQPQQAPVQVPSEASIANDVYDLPAEKKKSKTIEISNLTKKPEEKMPAKPAAAAAASAAPSIQRPVSGTGAGQTPHTSSMFAYGDDEGDDSDDGTGATTTSSSTGYFVHNPTQSSSSATGNGSASSSNAPAVTGEKLVGDLGLPTGFFDDPREDIESRGLNVKDEIKKKDKEQDEALKSFLGEVEAIVGVDDVDEELGKEGKAEAAEVALQLAYATRTAHFMATVEKNIDKHRDSNNASSSSSSSSSSSQSVGASMLSKVEVAGVNAMISETSGLKRSANENILDDVMTVMLKKKQRLNDLKGNPMKKKEEINDGTSTSRNNDAGGVEESAGSNSSEESESESDYEPLDFTDWHSRAL
jgi:hypothetical protein